MADGRNLDIVFRAYVHKAMLLRQNFHSEALINTSIAQI